MIPVRKPFLVAVACASLAVAASARGADPLADEIARWSRFLKENASKDELWVDLKRSVEPGLQRAGQALADGDRALALQRFAIVQPNLAAAEYVLGLPEATRKSAAGFEAERARMGRELRKELSPGAASPATLSGMHPAVVRAVGEAALPRVKVYYDTSLEYGRNTMPDSGLFYVGAAAAQRDFVRFLRTLSEKTPGREPSLRPIAAELDALEAELLAAYRPPASIDRHMDFILGSSAVKEARELDDAGLRYGALLRYLQAVQRAAPLVKPAPSGTSAEVAAAISAFDERIAPREGGVDHSIGRVFLESARFDLAHPVPDKEPELAPVVLADVLPRYFAALEPAPARRVPTRPEVTVTLVRWPYT